VWTKDAETGTPLLCISGQTAVVKIVNALTGKLQSVSESNQLLNQPSLILYRFLEATVEYGIGVAIQDVADYVLGCG